MTERGDHDREGGCVSPDAERWPGWHCCWCLIFFCDRCLFWRMERVSLSSPGSSACLSVREWLLCEVTGVKLGHLRSYLKEHLLKSMQRTMMTGFGIILVVNWQARNWIVFIHWIIICLWFKWLFLTKRTITFFCVSCDVKELFTYTCIYLFNTTQYDWFDKVMFEDNRNTALLSPVCMSIIYSPCGSSVSLHVQL